MQYQIVATSNRPASAFFRRLDRGVTAWAGPGVTVIDADSHVVEAPDGWQPRGPFRAVPVLE